MSVLHQHLPPFPSGTAGIVLAGGLSRRMGGGCKPLLDLGGRLLIARVADRLGCAAAVSANADPAGFAFLGLPVLPDSVPGHPGPLAGVLAALDWAAAGGIARIVTAAGDTPFFPADLAPRLSSRLAAGDAPIVMAAHDGHDHPAFAAWDADLREPLRRALAAGTRRMRHFMDAHGALRVPFSGRDPFFNINTPEDMAQARLRLAVEGDEWT